MLRFVARLLLRIFCDYEVRGPIPSKPPEKLLIIGNHQSFIDPLFVMAYCPFDVTWVTHEQIAAKYPLREIRDGGAYPTDRTLEGSVVRP